MSDFVMALQARVAEYDRMLLEAQSIAEAYSEDLDQVRVDNAHLRAQLNNKTKTISALKRTIEFLEETTRITAQMCRDIIEHGDDPDDRPLTDDEILNGHIKGGPLGIMGNNVIRSAP